MRWRLGPKLTLNLRGGAEGTHTDTESLVSHSVGQPLGIQLNQQPMVVEPEIVTNNLQTGWLTLRRRPDKEYLLRSVRRRDDHAIFQRKEWSGLRRPRMGNTMSFFKTLVVSALTISVSQVAFSDHFHELTRPQRAIIEEAIKAKLTHPEKAIFMPPNLGIQPDDDDRLVWVCGSLRATDEAGNYLADSSEYLGHLHLDTGVFEIDHFALTSLDDRHRILDSCIDLHQSVE